jgi:class 3 adenylate cyclase
VDIGQRTGDSDLLALAMTVLGSLQIATGQVSNGFELMEEAAVAAVSGELSTFMTGVTCCNMIAACRDLSDYQRAREWTEAAEAWCKRESVSGFPGICRVHRGEVVALTGAWERAEEELRQATDELAAYNAAPPMGDGFYAIAEIRHRKGDLAGAEEALRQAHSLGHSPQPLLAKIRLTQGKPRVALAGINAAVEEQSWDKWARARLLPTQIEVAVAAGDPGLARRGAEELSALVDTYQSPAMQAGKHEAWGRVLLAEGDAAGAVRELRGAVQRWREIAAPYETARSRTLLSAALRALHVEGEADLEIETARVEFDRLGAAIDEAAAQKAIEDAAARRADPVQTHKAFMFTDIVGSTNLAELLGNDAWEHLLQWHDDALQSVFARHGGEVVNSTGDGFFVAFDTARQGIEAAIAIQRELADHRRTTGFAPMVRIGVHAAEANRHGSDYSGIGVHVAARVAALAGGGEIVVTEETLMESGGVPSSEAREATLKGVAAPVKVVTVDWS